MYEEKLINIRKVCVQVSKITAESDFSFATTESVYGFENTRVPQDVKIYLVHNQGKHMQTYEKEVPCLVYRHAEPMHFCM